MATMTTYSQWWYSLSLRKMCERWLYTSSQSGDSAAHADSLPFRAQVHRIYISMVIFVPTAATRRLFTTTDRVNCIENTCIPAVLVRMHTCCLPTENYFSLVSADGSRDGAIRSNLIEIARSWSVKHVSTFQFFKLFMTSFSFRSHSTAFVKPYYYYSGVWTHCRASKEHNWLAESWGLWSQLCFHRVLKKPLSFTFEQTSERLVQHINRLTRPIRNKLHTQKSGSHFKRSCHTSFSASNSC